MHINRHPGHSVLGIMLERNWALDEIASRMECDRELVHDLLLGYESVTPEIAESLHKATGVSVSFWINLQNKYDQTAAVIDSLPEPTSTAVPAA